MEDFVNNKLLLKEIINCKDIYSKNPKRSRAECVSSSLASMIIIMVDKYAGKYNFRGYSYNDDMRAEALLHSVKGILQFDPKKSNQPFAYLTTIIHRAFIQVIGDEKKVTTIRNEMMHGLGEQGLGEETDYNQNNHDLDGTKRIKATKRAKRKVVIVKKPVIPKKVIIKTSKYRGVKRAYNRWSVQIGGGKRGVNINLGSFENEIEAARAYDLAALKKYGKNWRYLNFQDYDK